MLYLKKHDVLFLKPRKVAGTSFEIAMSKFADPDDIITPIVPDDEAKRAELGFPGARNYRRPVGDVSLKGILGAAFKRRWPMRFFNHISAKDARQRLGPSRFDAALKVSIVRNPYDVLVSLYYWNNRNSEKPLSFAAWLRQNSNLINVNDEQYFIDGKCVIDFFVRYEHLRDDIMAFEERKPAFAGLADLVASISAKGNVRPKATEPDRVFSEHPDLVSAVRFFNAQLCDDFGYSAA